MAKKKTIVLTLSVSITIIVGTALIWIKPEYIGNKKNSYYTTQTWKKFEGDEKIKVLEFQQMLRNPVTLNIKSDPDGATQTILNAVNKICHDVNIPFQRAFSEELIIGRYKFLESININNTSAEAALRTILEPYHLKYRLNTKGLYLFKNSK